MKRNSRKDVTEFLAQKRIAAVGVSKKPKEFGRYLFDYLIKSGYDVVPVNPSTTEVAGQKCYATVMDIQPPVSAALLLTPPAATETVVRECAASGINFIWMYRATGVGAVSDAAVAFCREHGMRVIAGECPLMFLPNGGVHRIHGLIKRITGSYPN
jgi:uncharacterized protein